MCGIVGYVGKRVASDYLLEGLRRLEYRGYDSAGLAVLESGSSIDIRKSVGRVDRLAKKVVEAPLSGGLGIGHTRWATHGVPSDENAHPHYGGNQDLALVHNGVIENYQQLRERLEAQGYLFRSATDTEVIAHLLSDALEHAALPGTTEELAALHYEPLLEAFRKTLSQLRGTYGLAVLFNRYPDLILVARLGSPLVIGVGEDEHFLASDASPLVGYTDQIVYLRDHEMAVLRANDLHIVHRDAGSVRHQVQTLDIEPSQVGKDGHAHYMLKEIYEQPETLRNAMRGRINRDEATSVFGGLNLDPQQLRSIDRLVLTACGTSYHAALVGEYLIEEFARIPVEVEYASELRYRNPPLEKGTLVFAITQSGETADTLAAMREMQRKGFPTLAICNVVGSTIAQEAHGGIYLHAGPEIGVASTKAFTSQCCVLTLLALYFGRLRHLTYAAGQRIITQLEQLPTRATEALKCRESVRAIAEKYADCNNFLYLGRQYNYPTALEGALKLKEISYIHAEGYPAAEMKHGPIALVDEKTPTVFIVPQGYVYEKVMANMEEIKARGGPVIAIVCEGDDRAAQIADDVIEIPHVEEFLQPIIASIPLQLLAYDIASLRGCDVDKPRNLAKSVTVE